MIMEEILVGTKHEHTIKLEDLKKWSPLRARLQTRILLLKRHLGCFCSWGTCVFSHEKECNSFLFETHLASNSCNGSRSHIATTSEPARFASAARVRWGSGQRMFKWFYRMSRVLLMHGFSRVIFPSVFADRCNWPKPLKLPRPGASNRKQFWT